MLQNTHSEIVSDNSETLILVDAQDNVLGHLDKASCHNSDGVLHRAFSLFVFNQDGHLLIQRRAPNKRLWPNYWANSCCSHPRQGESLDVAVQRRCQQELGFVTPMQFLYKFEYSARYDRQGSEHELCSVFIGRFDGQPNINISEIGEWQWIDQVTLEKNLAEPNSNYTPWFKLEWQHLCAEFAHLLPER